MYYRYEIYEKTEYIGGLFRGITIVLDDLNNEAEQGYECAIADYDYLDMVIGGMEEMLISPDLYAYDEVTFYFTEHGYSLVKEQLEGLAEVLSRWGYTLVEDVVETVGDIVYEDVLQVAV